jgi:hypothetical protein
MWLLSSGLAGMAVNKSINPPLSYQGWHSNVSQVKVLSVLVGFESDIKPKKKHYTNLKVDEFGLYAGVRKQKERLIYTY